MRLNANTMLDYQANLTRNRQVFLLNHSDAFHAFTQIDENFVVLRNIVRTGRDSNNRTHVSFLPFLLLMQRQAMIAFDCLWSYQSFEAWVLLRPCLESVLIMGKWVDDPANATIWSNRESDRTSYARTYSGRNLQSTSLPRSDEIQSVLSRINDDFMHTNPQYYARHTELQAIDRGNHAVLLHFFDNEHDHRAHLYAILHLLVVVQDSLLSMFRNLFSGLDTVTVGLAELEALFGDQVRAFLAEQPDSSRVITELGLWQL